MSAISVVQNGSEGVLLGLSKTIFKFIDGCVIGHKSGLCLLKFCLKQFDGFQLVRDNGISILAPVFTIIKLLFQVRNLARKLLDLTLRLRIVFLQDDLLILIFGRLLFLGVQRDVEVFDVLSELLDCLILTQRFLV